MGCKARKPYDQTRAAVENCIGHWEDMRDNPDCEHEPTADYCALCSMFLESIECGRYECPRCPLAMKYGKCGGGGANPWSRAMWAWLLKDGGKSYWKDWQKEANRMIDALKEVLDGLEE